ncbi:putative DNA-dependent ATPase RAD57 PWA37_003720 [Arxiozyma heterogenica]|uniref:putative DNA-dependent ATPase RAD57 n=1 Tax=Arxiozyma heterogenica TaxID=278026 RepID=UPI002F1874FC
MDLYDELPQSKLLYELEFSQLLDNAKKNNVTTIDFLTLNISELSKILQRSVVEVNKFQSILVDEFNGQYKSQNVLTPLHSQNSVKLHSQFISSEDTNPAWFTTGDIKIDEILGGGIFIRGITEIFGESSTGKSQLLMQLSLTVQLPLENYGLNGKCVFITTEGDLTTQRIQQILAENPLYNNENVSLDNIFTVTCNDLTTQEHILDVQLPILLDRNKDSIKLIIIDSISHHLRVELENTSIKNSQVNRFYVERLAEKLLYLANKYELSVVVANQVGNKPLLENAEPVRQIITDYDYQVGWLVGWKDSSILYRHKYNSMDISTSNLTMSNGAMNYKDSSKNLHQSNTNSDNLRFSQVDSFQLETILSDDEDSMLIEKEVNKFIEASNRIKSVSESALSIRSLENNESDPNNNYDNGNYNMSDMNSIGKSKQNLTLNTADIEYSKEKINKKKSVIIRKKRRLDSIVPNLGLSWANYVSTRILLKKSYKASPMIKRGELKIYQGIDESSFWQVKRDLTVVFSSYCEPKSITYAITKQGIKAIEI